MRGRRGDFEWGFGFRGDGGGRRGIFRGSGRAKGGRRCIVVMGGSRIGSEGWRRSPEFRGSIGRPLVVDTSILLGVVSSFFDRLGILSERGTIVTRIARTSGIRIHRISECPPARRSSSSVRRRRRARSPPRRRPLLPRNRGSLPSKTPPLLLLALNASTILLVLLSPKIDPNPRQDDLVVPVLLPSRTSLALALALLEPHNSTPSTSFAMILVLDHLPQKLTTPPRLSPGRRIGRGEEMVG